MEKTDTIAAIATGLTDSGIGIVRVSGGQSFQVVDRIFRKKDGSPIDRNRSHTLQYGFIYRGGEKLDEVMVALMKAPHSYTAEDTAEINCHGGILMMQRILETVTGAGARAAEPGEFTKRAFLNGRIDLSQAEAVMDVIRAENDFALKSSIRQLGGSLSAKIRELRARILYQTAYIESALDDPEHIPMEGYGEKLLPEIERMSSELHEMIRTADYGRILSEGIRTVILGKPNAGKSSLMNALLDRERAIVTEVAGTTRDTLEEKIRMGDLSLILVDTAGIREAADEVEKIGVARSRAAAESADLILYVADCSVPLDENDAEILRMIHDKKTVVLLNKSDLAAVTDAKRLGRLTGKKVIAVSARERTGLEALEEELKSMFREGQLSGNDQILITNVRHREALEDSLESLSLVKESILQGLPEDFYTIDLMNAYARLGNIIGESVEEDVVNEIFSKFCTGK